MILARKFVKFKNFAILLKIKAILIGDIGVMLAGAGVKQPRRFVPYIGGAVIMAAGGYVFLIKKYRYRPTNRSITLIGSKPRHGAAGRIGACRPKRNGKLLPLMNPL